MLLVAKASDVIWYFKIEDRRKEEVQQTHTREIGLCKYKEMLVTTVKDPPACPAKRMSHEHLYCWLDSC
jgi:hypothetical protein